MRYIASVQSLTSRLFSAISVKSSVEHRIGFKFKSQSFHNYCNHLKQIINRSQSANNRIKSEMILILSKLIPQLTDYHLI